MLPKARKRNQRNITHVAKAKKNHQRNIPHVAKDKKTTTVTSRMLPKARQERYYPTPPHPPHPPPTQSQQLENIAGSGELEHESRN